MGRTLRRTAAFTALWRALTAGARGGPGIGARLAAVPRMIKATLLRRYDGFGRLAMLLAATVYVVLPIDAVPELFLSVFGLIDDAFVVTWIAGTLLAETDRFLQWETGQRVRKPTIIDADVATPPGR